MTKLELEGEQIMREYNYLRNKFIGKEIIIMNFSKIPILYKIIEIDKKLQFDLFNTKKEYWEVIAINTCINKYEYISNSNFTAIESFLAKISSPYFIACAKIDYLNKLIQYKLTKGTK